MATLQSRGVTGGSLHLKHAPVGTPMFDAEAPGVGMPGSCCGAVAKYGPLAVGPFPQLQASGEGQAAVARLYAGFYNTSTP